MHDHAQGLLLGRPSAKEIADALAEDCGCVVTEIQPSNVSFLSDHAIVHFRESGSGRLRMLSVFGDKAILPGAETLDADGTCVAIGEWGEGSLVVRSLAERFGGWLRASDRRSASPWEEIEPAMAMAGP